MIHLKSIVTLKIFLIFTTTAWCDSGYELWLNYKPTENSLLKSEYASYLSNVEICPNRYKKEISGELERAASQEYYENGYLFFSKTTANEN